jgi:hypothetical protein
MNKNRNQIIVSVLFEEFLLDKVEGFRRACMQRSGHMSRSAAVRHLVDRGLTVSGGTVGGSHAAFSMAPAVSDAGDDTDLQDDESATDEQVRYGIGQAEAVNAAQ